MIKKEIRPGFWMLSAVDKDLRVFMGDSYTDSGLMINSYLAVGKDEAVIFGAFPAKQTEEWIEQIKSHVNGKRLAFVAFCDRNDARTLEALAEICTDIRLVGSAAALHALDSNAKTVSIRGQKALMLCEQKWSFSSGNGGNIIACCDELKLVVSGSAYGSYCATEDKDDWLRGAANYRRDNPRPWEVPEGTELICPMCGPIVENISELTEIYADIPCKKSSLAILTDGSAFVEALARSIANGLTDSGVRDVESICLMDISRNEVLRRAANAGALLFGFSGEAPKSVLDILTSLKKADCKDKLAAAFVCAESSKLRTYLEPMGFDLSVSDFNCIGKPDDATLKVAYEYGFAFGCSLQRIPNPRAPKLVKCLVCGEVFDASLGICPVCGVGLDQCIPAEEDAVKYANDTDRDYLIIGGGIAAVSAAEAIRKRDKTGAIDIISAENVLPINRPMITKDLQTALYRPEELAVHGEDWYEELGIKFSLGTKVVAIDPAKKCVTLDSGDTMRYDKLIYALGGECLVPPFKGVDKKGIVSIRHLSDIETLEKLLSNSGNAVVIGGGVLGLEAASELHRFGLKVTVLESAPQICARQIDELNAAAFLGVMERLGVPCYEGVNIEEIYGDASVKGVRLADGREFPADVVVVSCGIKSSTELAQTAGIKVERSVVVNEYMETSAPDIYACGDCAVYDGVNMQLWQEAVEQGKVAGANAVGERLSFVNKPLGFSLVGFGASLFAIGDVGKGAKPYRTVELVDSVRGKGESYFFVGGRLEGAIVFNKNEKIDSVSTAVLSHARYDELF